MNAQALLQVNYRSIATRIAQVLAVALVAAVPLSNSVTTVLSLLLAIAVCIQLDVATIKTVGKNPITIAVLTLLALVGIDAIFSIADPIAIKQGLRKSLRLIYIPLLLPLFAQYVWRLAAGVAYLAAVTLSIGLALWQGEQVFKDPIFTSLFTAFAIFMLAHYSVEYKRWRMLTVPLALLFTYYLFFVNTGRTGQCLFIALYGIFCWQRLSPNIKMLSTATACLLGLLCASSILPSSFQKRQAVALQEVQQFVQSEVSAIPNTSSVGMRLILAKHAWEVIRIKPISGSGTGGYALAFAEHASDFPAKQEFGANPHNQYLLTWVELGLPGLLSLLGLFATCAWMFTRSKSLEHYLGFGLVTSFAIGCTMNSWLLDFASTFFFVVMVGVFAGATLLTNNK